MSRSNGPSVSGAKTHLEIARNQNNTEQHEIQHHNQPWHTSGVAHAFSGVGCETLWRENQSGITGVHASELNMFMDGSSDEFTVSSNAVHLNFEGTFNEVGNNDGVVFRYRCCLSQGSTELLIRLRNVHGSTTEHIGRADQN